MVDADFYALFNRIIREHLKSVTLLRVNRATGRIFLSFSNEDDFVCCVIGAASANLPTKVTTTFAGRNRSPRSVASCVLQISMSELDDRLAIMLLDVLMSRFKDGSISESDYIAQRDQVSRYVHDDEDRHEK